MHASLVHSILWPLFHYLPGEINFEERDYAAYVAVNQAFADAVAPIVRHSDTVWVQDYHLMLMPAMLRRALSEEVHVRIGFFLHTPFPSSEVYRYRAARTTNNKERDRGTCTHTTTAERDR
jgi:trehalose-6-phosphate synthase